MSNYPLVGSRLRTGLLMAALLGPLGLSGCGSGGGDETNATSAQDPAVTAAWRGNRDRIAPSVPADVAATVVSSAQINLAWSASSDNRGVAGYRIRRNGTLLTTVGKDTTTYEDTGLTASTAFSYTVRAFDEAGNVSAQSQMAGATTLAADSTPPMVSATSPANDAINIAVNSAITVTFSEVMLTSTLSTDTFKLATRGGLPISGTVNVSGNTATFTPSADLPASTQFTATITNGVTDSAGNALPDNFTWNFTTGATPDTTPPTVSATSPVNAATSVALNTSVSATFSEAMTNATLTSASFRLATTSGDVAVSGTVNVSGNTETFTPSANLAGSTQYTATITTAAEDAAGNALAAAFTWSFTTAAVPDTTPPTVSATSPVNAATGVALDTSVSATFTEAMTNATLTSASFRLATTSGGVAVGGTVDVSGNTATFTPSANLAGSTQYTATITTAAEDAAGNALAASFNWNFTTTTPPPPVPTVSLAANPTSITSDGTSTLIWSSTNATSCTASGGWSGTKLTSDSQSTGVLTGTTTFSLECTGPSGTAAASITVTVSATGAISGLNFPGSAAVSTTMRFRFLNPLAIYPATYIWRAYPRRQAGYYTAFFWGNDDGKGLDTFWWTSNGSADTYYGAHPYPNPSPDGTAHNWEIAVETADFVSDTFVVYDRWYIQALRVWSDASGRKHHEFYWDLPNTDAAHVVTRISPSTYGNTNPPVPALTWGDAPWNPGKEVWNGILRGIQVYSADLSVTDILSEASTPFSTSAGAASIWYLNLNPTPSDISDKSGRGHNPAWVGTARPSLWSE